MNHLPFTLLAYLLNSISVTIDKFLLTKKIPDPIIYVFYFSCVSLLALVLIPFTKAPSLNIFILASISTLLWTTGAYLMFKALQIGQVSRVIPLIGTLVPIILLFQDISNQNITSNQVTAVVILILGMIVLTFPDWKGKITLQEIIFIILSSLFFAVSYVVLRTAYLRENFMTVFVYSRPILIPVGLTILAIPSLRRKVFQKDIARSHAKTRTGILFVLGQVAGGIGELLLTFSISLATPSLVNSLQGSQYAFLFLLSLVLGKKFPDVFKDKLTTINLLGKITGIILIGGGLYILAFANTLK